MENENANSSKSTGNPILDALSKKNSAAAPEVPVVNPKEEVPNISTEEQEAASESQTQRDNPTPSPESDPGKKDEANQGLDDPEKDPENKTDDVPKGEKPSGEWWEDENSPTVENSPIENSSEVDYSAISKAIGLDSSEPSKVIDRVNEIQSQNKELIEKLKSNEDNSNFASPQLQEANDIAKSGGDYLAYLGISQNNWDQVPDEALIVEAQLRPYFGEDLEGMQAHLDSMTDSQKGIQANSIRADLKAKDEKGKKDIANAAREKKMKIDSGIRKYLDSTKSVFGLDISAGDKRKAYDSIVSGDFVKQIFNDKNGQTSPEKIVNAYMAINNISKIVKTAVTKSRNSATQELLDEVSNPNIKKNGQTVETKTVNKSAHPMDAVMSGLRGG